MDTVALDIVTTQDMLDELVGWWEEARDDDMPSPDQVEVYTLFEGADASILRHTLLHAEGAMYRAAAAAALGALQVFDALPELVQARYDPDEDVRSFARWAACWIDEWAGCYDLWDFLLAAARLEAQTGTLRQLRMF